MIDVHLPTSDGHTIILSRYTNPTPSFSSFSSNFKLELPDQPPTKTTASGRLAK
jgi:hypothetical protein